LLLLLRRVRPLEMAKSREWQGFGLTSAAAYGDVVRVICKRVCNVTVSTRYPVEIRGSLPVVL